MASSTVRFRSRAWLPPPPTRPALLWFTRDLRLHDQPALQAAGRKRPASGGVLRVRRPGRWRLDNGGGEPLVAAPQPALARRRAVRRRRPSGPATWRQRRADRGAGARSGRRRAARRPTQRASSTHRARHFGARPGRARMCGPSPLDHAAVRSRSAPNRLGRQLRCVHALLQSLSGTRRGRRRVAPPPPVSHPARTRDRIAWTIGACSPPARIGPPACAQPGSRVKPPPPSCCTRSPRTRSKTTRPAETFPASTAYRAFRHTCIGAKFQRARSGARQPSAAAKARKPISRNCCGENFAPTCYGTTPRYPTRRCDPSSLQCNGATTPRPCARGSATHRIPIVDAGMRQLWHLGWQHTASA